jgi:hypothetical protein
LAEFSNIPVAVSLLLYLYRFPTDVSSASRSSRFPPLHEPRWVTSKWLQSSPNWENSGALAARLAVSGPFFGSVPAGKKRRSPDESVASKSGSPSPLMSPAWTGVAGFQGT